MNSPAEIETLCQQAKRSVRHGEHDQAIALFNQALEMDSGSFDAHYGIATVYFLLNRFEDAAGYFQQASQLDLKQGKALINLGAVYNRLGEYQKAVDALRRGLQKERDSCEGYYNLGYAQRKLDQSSMAISAYREALRINPDMIDAHMNLANTYRDMGNFGQAKTHYRQALKLKPDFDRAEEGLKKVQQAESEKRKEFSPFGRLVEEEGIHVDSTPQLEHELSDEEREEDRFSVHNIANEIERSAKELRSYFQENFEPGMIAITRASIESSGNPDNLEEAQKSFREMLDLADKYRGNLKKLIDELREHEDSITAPQSTTSE